MLPDNCGHSNNEVKKFRHPVIEKNNELNSCLSKKVEGNLLIFPSYLTIRLYQQIIISFNVDIITYKKLY